MLKNNLKLAIDAVKKHYRAYDNDLLELIAFDIERLPSAQPNHNAEVSKMEIIHCKDCKFAHMTVNGECKYCDIWFPDEKTYMPGDYFCASAERIDEAE